MGGKRRQRGMPKRLVLGAALTLAGAGAGITAALATSAWWARTAGGAIGGMIGLGAAVWIDRSVERRAAREQRASALDPVTTDPGHDDSVFGVLLATRAIAPFRGRTADLAWLDHWCDDRKAHPVAVITGPAGTGKTRLATEFATQRPASWVAGWLRPGRGSQALTAVRACGDPTLILVDDADDQPDLIALLEDLAPHAGGPPVRVVLISRAADPCPQIGSHLSDRHQWIAANALVRRVGYFGSSDDHARWFAEAARAYAAARHTPPPNLPAPTSRSTTHTPNEPILTVHAQALLAVLETESQRPLAAKLQTLPFDQVAQALFNHEQRRWQQAAQQPHWGITELTPPVQERAIAALTLTTASDRDQASAALRQVPDLIDAPAERLANITRWATHLYPSDPPWPLRIQPAMLAEWFIVTQLTTSPQLTHNLTHQAPARAQALLVPLAHASDNLSAAAPLFAQVIAADVTSLLPAGIAAALTASQGQPLLDRALASLIAQASWTAETFTGLGHQLPSGLLPNTQAAMAVARTGHLRASGTPAELASSLNGLGTALRELGHHQDALAATEEALSTYRELAAANPALRPELANTLKSLGIDLRDLGRYQDALAADEEALSTYRELAAANPALRPGLANTLTNLGIDLSDLGRYQDALTATEEALSLHRELAAANPALRLKLANTLTNLGIDLRDLGRYQDALTATEEALSLYRQLAAANPARQPNVANALNNLGFDLHDLGRYQDALAVAEEAVRMYRELAAANPARQPNLANALTNLGADLRDLANYQDALTATEEAVSLYRQLAAANPAHQPNLANALNNLGVDLRDLGRHQDALTATEEALSMHRQLAAANPAHQPNLARVLNNLGGELRELGRYQDALTATEEAVSLYRQLAAANPARQPNLANALTNLGLDLRKLGRHQDAFTADREAVETYRKLTETDPELYEDTYRRVLARLRRDLDLAGDKEASIQLHLREDNPPGDPPPQIPPPQHPPIPDDNQTRAADS